MPQTSHGAERVKNAHQWTRINLRGQGIAQRLHIGFELRPMVLGCGARLAAPVASKIKNSHFKIGQQDTPKDLITIHR